MSTTSLAALQARIQQIDALVADGTLSPQTAAASQIGRAHV